MENKINCKEVLNSICAQENISDLSSLDDKYKDHLKSCNKCQAYISSLNSTIELYKSYNVKLPADIQKKILNNVCSKLRFT
jgi:hypothetical protein